MRKDSIQKVRACERKNLYQGLQKQESSINFFREPNTYSKKNFRRVESATSLNKRCNHDIKEIENRYRILEHNYKKILQEAQIKADIYQIQNEKLESLRKIVEKDEKEILRLNSMIKLAKNQPEVLTMSISKTGSKELWKKREISSTGESELASDSNQEERNQKITKQSRKSSKYKRSGMERGTREQSRSPLSKMYRFVPSLPLG